MKKISTALLIFSLFSLGLAQDPGGPDSMWVEITNPTIPGGGGNVIFHIKLLTDNAGSGNDIYAISVPLYITNTNPGANPILDSSRSSTFSGTAVSSGFGLGHVVKSGGGIPSFFPLNYQLWAWKVFGTGLTSGTYIFANVKINLSDTTTICIDTMTTDPGFSFYLTTSSAVEYYPNWNHVCSNISKVSPSNFKVTIRAFSPVNLVVTDPVTDSIGLDTTGTRPDTIFNTIDTINSQIASYDTTQDANSDGENDVIITIPFPYDGPYQIRVVPTDTGSFSLDYQAGNNLRVVLADSVVITTTDTNFTYGLEVLPFLRGDANKDRSRNLTDIIYLKNYVFGVPQGPPPDPMELGNVNCDLKPNGSQKVDIVDVIYMVNFVFRGGPPPCS